MLYCIIMKQINKLFYYSLIFSLITHTIVIFHDQIVISLFFKPNGKQKKQLEIIKDNKLKLKRSIHNEKNKKLLSKMFEKDEKDVIQKAEKKYLKEINKNTGAVLAKLFKGFSTKDLVREKNLKNYKSNGKLNITFKKDHDRINNLENNCDNFYIGLGLLLDSPFNDAWKIKDVSKDSIAHDIGIKKGDYLLGVKNTQGQFYEGNELVSKLQKKGSDLSVIVIYEQDGILKEKNIVLEKVCYIKEKNK
jgi:C-terminal processing protease CtpA/Prc